MREELIIKDFLRSWLKPSDGRSLKVSNFDSFIEVFIDDQRFPLFNEKEKETLKQILFFGDGIGFSTGYPQGDKETPRLARIYITEGGWQQGQQGGNYLGSRTREGRASTQITVTGINQGDNFNFEHPSLMIRLITAILISGEGILIAKRIFNQTISETDLSMDQSVTYGGKLNVPIRSLLLSYDSRRSGAEANK